MRMKKQLFIIQILTVVLFLFFGACSSVTQTGDFSSVDGLLWIDQFLESDPDDLIASVNKLGKALDEDVRVLFSEAEYTYDEQGRLNTVYRSTYRILTEKGVDGWSDISISWHPWYQEQPEVRVRIVNPDGRVHYLKKEDLIESASRQNSGKIFSDDKSLRAPLPSVTIGSIIEKEIIRQETIPYYEAGKLSNWYFKMRNHIDVSRVIIHVPDSISFKYKINLMPGLVPEIKKEGGVSTYTFTLKNLEPSEPVEVGIPSDQPRWESLRFTNGESWNAVASYYSKKVDEGLDAYDFSQLISSIDYKELSVRETAVLFLLELNKKVRYTGLELGEKSIIPANPVDTLERGFGDCKDKALLLTGMLREAGYDANVALLNVNSSEDTDSDLPGMGWFDHAIVYINEEGGFWMDATSEFDRLGYLSNSDRDRYALVASEDTKELIKTEEKKSADNIYKQTRIVRLADEKKGKITEFVEYFGSLESFFRAKNFYRDDEKREESWKEYVKSEYRGGELENLKVSDPLDMAKPFTVSFDVEDVKITFTDEYRAQLVIFPDMLLEWLPDVLLYELEDPRKNELSLSFPYTIEREHIIYPPEGFIATNLPEDEEYVFGTMTALRTVVDSGDYVSVYYTFNTGKEILTVEEFNETSAALFDYYREDGLVINFYHEGQILLEEEDYKAALKKFQELITLDPDNALHHLRYSRALLRAGFASSAAKALEEAILLIPDSAEFYGQLSWTLQHDVIARRFSSGFQRAAAIEALEKAIELDPENWEHFGNLAILYEYNEYGIRYSNQDDMLKAAEYYLKARKLEDALEVNLLMNYFHSGKYELLDEFLKEIEKNELSETFELLYEVGVNGIEAAVNKASKINPREKRKAIYADAADQLIDKRMYKAAVRFLLEAAKGSSNAMKLEQRADYISQIIPWEEVSGSVKNPEDLMTLYYKGLIGKDGVDYTVLEYISHPAFYMFGTTVEDKRSFDNEYLSILKECSDAGIRPDNILDSVLSGMGADVTENESGAVRVEIFSVSGGSSSRYLFAVKDKKTGNYQLAGMSGKLDTLGKVIADSYLAGDVELAKDLLELFYDEFYNHEDPKDPFFSLNSYEHFRNAEDLKDHVLYAGASLMRGSIYDLEMIEILEKGLKNADDKDKPLFYNSLYWAYRAIGNGKKYTECGEELYKAFPESEEAFIRYINSASDDTDFVKLEKEADLWMKENKDSSEIYSSILHKYGDVRQFEDADRIFKKMIRKNLLDAGDYNNYAWMGLFRPELTELDFSNARKAASMVNGRRSYILHTIAALYAEAGRCQEARTMLDEEIEITNEAEINSGEWYVLGRIAEEYGIIDFAIEAYNKVEKPEYPQFDHQSTWFLAQKRLQIIKENSGE